MNPSQFTKEQITSICSAVAVKVWEKFFEIRDTFGERELEKYETVDELPDDANNPIRHVHPRCAFTWKLYTHPNLKISQENVRASSKVLSIRSLELDESILAFLKLSDYFTAQDYINTVYNYGIHLGLSFHPLFRYDWLDEKEILKLAENPHYKENLAIRKPLRVKLEQYIHFMKTMASYGLIVIAFSPTSIIPVETGDIMLHPEWREYLESEERKEAEIERLKLEKKEKKKKEEKEQLIKELNERLEHARIESQKLRQARIESEKQLHAEKQSRKEGVIGFLILLFVSIFVLYSLLQTKARYLELPMY